MYHISHNLVVLSLKYLFSVNIMSKSHGIMCPTYFLEKAEYITKCLCGNKFLFSRKVLIWLRKRSEPGWIICFLTLLCGWKLWWLSKGQMTFSTSWKALVDHSLLLIPKFYCKPQRNLLGATVVNDMSSLFPYVNLTLQYLLQIWKMELTCRENVHLVLPAWMRNF